MTPEDGADGKSFLGLRVNVDADDGFSAAGRALVCVEGTLPAIDISCAG
jgi:hypothetical protein